MDKGMLADSAISNSCYCKSLPWLGSWVWPTFTQMQLQRGMVEILFVGAAAFIKEAIPQFVAHMEAGAILHLISSKLWLKVYPSKAYPKWYFKCGFSGV